MIALAINPFHVDRYTHNLSEGNIRNTTTNQANFLKWFSLQRKKVHNFILQEISIPLSIYWLEDLLKKQKQDLPKNDISATITYPGYYCACVLQVAWRGYKIMKMKYAFPKYLDILTGIQIFATSDSSWNLRRLHELAWLLRVGVESQIYNLVLVFLFHEWFSSKRTIRTLPKVLIGSCRGGIMLLLWSPCLFSEWV